MPVLIARGRARLVAAAALLGAASTALAGTPVIAATPLAITAFQTVTNLPVWIALDRGFLAKEGIDATMSPAHGAVGQMRDMMAGTYQIAVTAPDNIVGYTENQADVKLPGFDVVAFAGVHSSAEQVVATPEISGFADIKGKTVAVDALQSGYGFVLYRILGNHGLVLGRDYTVIAVGSGPQRLVAMTEGRAVAAVLDSPEDVEAQAKGFKILANGTAALGSYEGTVYAGRRAWAAANAAELKAFLRAMIAAHDYIYADRPGTVADLMQRVPDLSPQQAEAVYQRLTTGEGAINPKAEMSMAGLRTVLALRSEFAEPKMALDNPAKYIDLGYYEKARASQ